MIHEKEIIIRDQSLNSPVRRHRTPKDSNEAEFNESSVSAVTSILLESDFHFNRQYSKMDEKVAAKVQEVLDLGRCFR